VRGRLVAARLLTKIQRVELPGVDLEQATRLPRLAVEAVNAGTLGYALIVSSRDTTLARAATP